MIYKNTVHSYDELPGNVQQSLFEASGMEFLLFPSLVSSNGLYVTFYIAFSNGLSYFLERKISEYDLWNPMDSVYDYCPGVEEPLVGYDPRCRGWY